MRELLLTCLFAASAFAQAGKFGAFTNSDDVGAPPLKGSAEFDPSQRAVQNHRLRHRYLGQGRPVPLRLAGDVGQLFAVTATAKFLTEGNAHRKAVIMLRKTLDTDSPFVHLAIHGDGMPSVQFRNTKADNTNTVDFPVEGPGTWKLKLVRAGRHHHRLGRQGRCAAAGTRTYLQPVGQPGIGRPRRQLAHAGDQIPSCFRMYRWSNCAPPAGRKTIIMRDSIPDRRLLCCLPPFAQSESLGIFTNAGDVGDPAR